MPPFDASAERADESPSPSIAYHNLGYAMEPQCPHRGIAPPRGQHWTAADYEKKSTDFSSWRGHTYFVIGF